MQHFDLMVLGSGSGLEVSSEAAGLGLSVAIIEEGPFGGTCLNRGRIPSKMLIHCADVMDTIKNQKRPHFRHQGNGSRDRLAGHHCPRR